MSDDLGAQVHRLRQALPHGITDVDEAVSEHRAILEAFVEVRRTGHHGTVEIMVPLVDSVEEFTKIARSSGCSEVMAFATSAVRDASNTDTVLAHVKQATVVDVEVLSGADESRLTALAVRRWYGWSVGRVLNIDIGGGSLEMSNGVDEEPDVALSLPLGAGRITREWLPDDPPGRRRVAMLRDWLDAEMHPEDCHHGTRAHEKGHAA